MSELLYDFRSDTVTRPGPAMREAMATALVGDDVYGDDPTVSRLEAVAAERLGKEAALFVSSGTQSNLIGLMVHCGRGDEYIVGQMAHTYRFEGGGAAVLGSIQPQPLENRPDGTLELDEIEKAIKPDDSHFARTRLLALENTFNGTVLPTDYVASATDLAHRHGLACHLDGARLFNASVALGVDIAELAKPFDTVSICLSKGLGAPVGSVLVGPQALMQEGRRLRKMLGGGMRQAGILAAAGLYALDNNVERLAQDHANARRLAVGLSNLPGLSVDMPDTNIVFLEVRPELAEPFAHHLRVAGVGINTTYAGRRQRWVTHLDVDADAVDAAIGIVRAFIGSR